MEGLPKYLRRRRGPSDIITFSRYRNSKSNLSYVIRGRYADIKRMRIGALSRQSNDIYVLR